jgi:outer membrane immunogenic protein
MPGKCRSLKRHFSFVFHLFFLHRLSRYSLAQTAASDTQLQVIHAIFKPSLNMEIEKMKKHFIGVMAAIPALFISAANAEGFYGSLKLQEARQNLTGALLTSPGVDHRIVSPGVNKETTGSIAAGYAFNDGWRLETEYTIKNDSQFKSYWAPFDANVNNMKTSSKRLMLNGYKDFPVTDTISLYAMGGLGVAHISSEGYQTEPGRRFANNSQNNFAYSLGAGADMKLNEQITVGVGYRHVNMGKIETGYNTFANRINARDEQLKGKLKEQNTFIEARYAF